MPLPRTNQAPLATTRLAGRAKVSTIRNLDDRRHFAPAAMARLPGTACREILRYLSKNRLLEP